jgi:hypothetical protein
VSDDPAARTTGGYSFYQRRHETHPAVQDPDFGARLVDYCGELSNQPARR